MNRIVPATLLCLSLFLTAACESSEERAEEHYLEGVSLLEAGDVDRALVEFRNVFRLDGTHREARRKFAEAEVGRGNIQAGYRQYLRLVEQYPDDVQARHELTRLALAAGEWEAVAQHAPHLIEVDAEDPIGRLADLGLRYREALEAEDETAQAEIVEEAADLREVLPQNPMIPELLADYFARQGRREDALEELGRAIELSDEPRRLYTMRLGLLYEMGDVDAVEAGLVEMVEKFPEDAEAQATLVRWYLSRDRIDQAEEFLRERAEEGGSTETIDLVRFLIEYRGREVAIAELDEAISEDAENATTYRSVRAGLIFESGEREEAIAQLQSIVDDAEEESDEIRNVKVALAQMLVETGNSVGARALIEDVLSSDANHVAALKMRAGWLIDADETDEAILALRTALEQSPRDPSLMTLMAQAYERAGNRALMAEMLSLAVEVSNNAPDETIRYARHLLSEDNADVAESTLMDSLRLNPGDVDVLRLLGSIYVEDSDWARATQIADSLADVDAAGAEAAANALRTQILAGQGRSEEVLGFLEGLAESGQGGFGTDLAIVRTHIESGNNDAALDHVESLLSERPDDPGLLFLKGAVLETQGRTDESEEIYERLASESPGSVVVWRALYLLQQRDGRREDASATLESAIEANPASLDLLWMKASELQRAGDLERALDIYAEMYEQDSSAPVVANNYASLLTTLRDDEESIQRAYAVARRLQGAEVPAFQDTYGWIAYLRGEYETAVEYLEPAADALTGDPSVQYHLGLAYAETGRVEDAKAALQRALDLVEDGNALPQADEARQKLAELEAGSEAAAEE